MKNNIYNLSAILIVSALSVMAFYYGEKVHSSFIRADEWRFLEIYLMPIYDGTFFWKNLFADVHGNFLDGILFIANAVYFDLTGDLFFYVGIISKILIFVLFAIVLKNNFVDKPNYYIFALLIIGTAFFSLKGTVEYQWPLVTRVYLFILMFLSVLYFLDKYLKSNLRSLTILLSILTISFLLLLSIKTAGLILLGSLIGLLFILSMIDTEKRIKFFDLIGILILAIVLIKISWTLLSLDTSNEVSNKINLNTFSIASFIESYALALFSGLIRIEIFVKDFTMSTVLVFAYIYLMVYFITIFYSIKLKTYTKTIIPLALMFYPLLFILGVLLYRYSPVTGQINWFVASPRYFSTYELGLIGLLWNLLLIFYGLKTDKFKSIIFYFLGFFFILVNIHYMDYSFKTSRSFIKAFSNADEKLYHYTGDQASLPKWLKGGSFSDEKVEFLKENNLNVFNDKYNFKKNKQKLEN